MRTVSLLRTSRGTESSNLLPHEMVDLSFLGCTRRSEVTWNLSWSHEFPKSDIKHHNIHSFIPCQELQPRERRYWSAAAHAEVSDMCKISLCALLLVLAYAFKERVYRCCNTFWHRGKPDASGDQRVTTSFRAQRIGGHWTEPTGRANATEFS